jgi:hypothetical protein
LQRALSPAEVLQLKIAIASETWSIASGPNAATKRDFPSRIFAAFEALL